jgi:hypothetical protein
MAASVDERIIRPSRYRRQHNRVRRVEAQIADVDGEIGDPFVAEGLLGRLERNGDIGSRERHAGEEFGRLFQLAHLDPLRAAVIVREGRGNGAGPHGSERARRRIIAAMDALGGHGSPCATAAWFVLGCELSMREWAMREGWGGRPLREEVAKGTLVGALGVLAKHFGV